MASKLLFLDIATYALTAGVTVETEITRKVIMGGLVKPGDILQIWHRGKMTNNANAKTPRIRLGSLAGTAYWAPAGANNAGWKALTEIEFTATNMQKGFASASGAGSGLSAGAEVTSTVDTSVDWPIIFSGHPTNAGDTMSVEAIRMTLFRP